MTAAPELETERLRLRQWRHTDTDAIAAFYGEERTARFVGGVIPRSEAWRRMAAFAGHWVLRGFGIWAIEEREGGRLAGYAGLWFPEGFPEVEVGWGLLPEFQGRGYATEAARRAIRFGMIERGLETLVSYIEPENVASRRVAERLGARFESVLRRCDWSGHVYRYPTEPSS